MIVEAAVEATGASGRELVADDGTVVTTGEPDGGGERLELPLTAGRTEFGTLTLVGDAFDDEQRMTATSLASHAAIALENARLHRIVERQALVDGLTGIANRRQCEDALTAEIARAERLGDAARRSSWPTSTTSRRSTTVHGHAAGDDVLREFAAVAARDRPRLRPRRPLGRRGVPRCCCPGADAEGGAQLADRVRRALSERTFRGRTGRPFAVTCSFGVAQHSQPRATSASSSPPPTGPSTGPSGAGKIVSRLKRPGRSF